MLAPGDEGRVPLSQYPEDSVIFVVGEAKILGACEILGSGDEDTMPVSEDSEGSLAFVVGEGKLFGVCVILTLCRPVVGPIGYMEIEPFIREVGRIVLFCHLAGGKLDVVFLEVLSGLMALFPRVRCHS
jgi:hypothetical protein